ncbi:MAG TPA: class I SAM-dependent methyltransferase [Ferruginibacter sp.]|nr:class I SAM-dependent methyltransferase [Ferruginibacter sp.]
MENSLDDHVKAYEGKIQYDFDNEILLTWYPQRILEHAKGARSLLELGLGHGYSTNIFSEHFTKHTVLDGSKAIIENFKSKYPGCKANIVETYFENFSTNDKFDLIVMGFVLEHVDDPVGILSRYKNFLSPGGKMFVAVPNAEVLNRRLGHLAGMLPNIQALSENDLMLGHKCYYTVETLRNDAEKAGYEIVRTEGIFLKPLTSYQLTSLNLDKRILDALCVVGIDYPELSCGILAELKKT